MVERIAMPSDLTRSTIMPSVTVHIPMPPGAATPAQTPSSVQAPPPPASTQQGNSRQR